MFRTRRLCQLVSSVKTLLFCKTVASSRCIQTQLTFKVVYLALSMFIWLIYHGQVNWEQQFYLQEQPGGEATRRTHTHTNTHQAARYNHSHTLLASEQLYWSSWGLSVSPRAATLETSSFTPYSLLKCLDKSTFFFFWPQGYCCSCLNPDALRIHSNLSRERERERSHSVSCFVSDCCFSQSGIKRDS